MHNLNKHVCIIDKPPSSDHLHLSTVFNVNFNDNVPVKNIHCTDKKVIKWCDDSRVSLDKYTSLTKSFFLNTADPSGLKCIDAKCTSMSHRNEIDICYNKLSSYLLQFSYENIPIKKETCSSYIILGFNDYVKYLHSAAWNAHVIWRAHGKLRDSHMRDESVGMYLCLVR